MRNKFSNLIGLLFWIVPFVALGQESVLVIPDLYATNGRLNQVIAADTAGVGATAWQVGTRVYALQKDGIFPMNEIFQIGNNRKLIIRAAYNSEISPVIDGTYDPMIWAYDAIPGTTTRPPGTLFVLGGTNNVLDLKHITISGFDEGNPGEVDGVQGQLINIVAAGGDGKGRIIIDSCILKSTNGNHIRTDGAPGTVRVTNTIFADMGNLVTSNLGAGKGIDVRANQVDTLDVRNCTFINFQDRLIRHYASTGPIKNLWFNNNTIINGLSFHGMMSLGDVDNTGAGVIQIKNNLLVDNFALGDDTCVVRQAEFNDSGENDPVNGKPRMTWITAKPNTFAHWDIANNYYAVSDSGRVMFNLPLPNGPYYRDEGDPLPWGINKRLQQVGGDSLTAFRRIGIAPVKIPDLMTRMIRWFYRPRSEGGNGKRQINYDPSYLMIEPGNWTYDYNRKSIFYYLDTLDCNYSASISLSGIGDPRWHQNSIFPYTLTVPGSVTKYPDDVTYKTGSIVKLTVTPPPGSIFTGWTGDASGSANPLIVTMNVSKNIGVSFSSGSTYTLTTSGLPTGKGDVMRNPDLQMYPSGATVTLTPICAEGVSFSHWGGDATGSANPLVITMNANKSITANFADACVPLPITPNPICTFTKEPNLTCYPYGTPVTLTVQPLDGTHLFTGWTIDPPIYLPDPLINPLILLIEPNMTVSANFVGGLSTKMNLIQPGSPVSGKAITKYPNLEWYNPSHDIVTLTAAVSTNPAIVPAGYEFKNWTGDTVGKTSTGNPTSISMATTRNISAVYGLKKYALTTVASPLAGGTIEKSGTSPYDTATVVTLTASANVGYHFVNWSGAVTGTTNPTTITMTAVKSVTANFVQDTMTITIPVYAGWNLISVPLLMKNPFPHIVFPSSYGDTFVYDDGAYRVADSIKVGRGYFVYFTAPGILTFRGVPVLGPIIVPLAAGWNLIGSREVPVNPSSLTTNLAGQIFGDLFFYTGGAYLVQSIINPGQGEWVYVLASCTLTFP
jgi:hypothetical protein